MWSCCSRSKTNTSSSLHGTRDGRPCDVAHVFFLRLQRGKSLNQISFSVNCNGVSKGVRWSVGRWRVIRVLSAPVRGGEIISTCFPYNASQFFAGLLQSMLYVFQVHCISKYWHFSMMQALARWIGVLISSWDFGSLLYPRLPQPPSRTVGVTTDPASNCCNTYCPCSWGRNACVVQLRWQMPKYEHLECFTFAKEESQIKYLK